MVLSVNSTASPGCGDQSEVRHEPQRQPHKVEANCLKCLPMELENRDASALALARPLKEENESWDASDAA
jgi:hypothetical protein